MNVLLTSVGRRAYLVKYFKEVLGDKGRVFVSNSDDKSVAFHYADGHAITPIIYDDNYIPFLLEYCQKNKINILISLFDIDLLVLAKNRERFLEIGTNVIVSDPKLIEVCNDKWKTYKFLTNNGFRTPLTFLSLEDALHAIDRGDLNYPVLVKPRFGCGSIGISIADNEMELRFYYEKILKKINKSYLKYESKNEIEKIIFQELLEGQEYGADIINDLNGELQAVNIRKKIAMRSGETDIAEIVDEPRIKSVLYDLGKKTKHIGNMDCDVFMVNGIPYVLEMNARFGGGYPFSHVAGCKLPQAIIDWTKNKDVDKNTLSCKTGVVAFKEIEITTL